MCKRQVSKSGGPPSNFHLIYAGGKGRIRSVMAVRRIYFEEKLWCVLERAKCYIVGDVSVVANVE
jgi:hypothetical protein